MDPKKVVVSPDERFRWFYNWRTSLGEMHDRAQKTIGVIDGELADAANQLCESGQFEAAASTLKWFKPGAAPVQ